MQKNVKGDYITPVQKGGDILLGYFQVVRNKKGAAPKSCSPSEIFDAIQY